MLSKQQVDPGAWETSDRIGATWSSQCTSSRWLSARRHQDAASKRLPDRMMITPDRHKP